MFSGLIAVATNKKKPKTAALQAVTTANVKKAIPAEMALASLEKKTANPAPKTVVVKTTRSATTASVKSSIPAETVRARQTKAKTARSVQVTALVLAVCCAIAASAKSKNPAETASVKAIKKKTA